MADNKVEFEIKIIGDAVSRLRQLTGQTDNLAHAAERTKLKLATLGSAFVLFNQAMEVVGKITSKMREFTDANRAQQEAEAKLGQVMRNTMDATNGEVEAIKALALAQQRLGIIGDEVQLAGAQELGTYLSKTESLRRLLPVMNDMLAQQYGYNATQEQSVQIASMMGKVMDGQVGALSRYGYKFDEAQEKLLRYGTEEQRVATLADVVTQSVGGMNEALAATPEGRIKQLSNNIGDVRERIGAVWVEVQGKLLPIMERLVGLADSLIDVVQMGWPMWIAASVAALVAVTKLRNRLAETSMAALMTGFSFTTMGAMAQAACRGISLAITSIPVVGWIAGAIALTIGIFQQLWTKCEAFRGFLTGTWEVLKNMLHNVIGIVNPVLGWILKACRAVGRDILAGIRTAINWVKSIFSGVGRWFNKVMRPVHDWFSNMWDTVKVMFQKIVDWMGRVVNPIIELWNKLTNGNVSKFKAGYDKGASKIRGNRIGGNVMMPNTVAAASGSVGMPAGAGVAATKGAEAAVTGGARNTTVNINLGSMVENIVFDGTLRDNAEDLENRIKEIMFRTLAMAATV